MISSQTLQALVPLIAKHGGYKDIQRISDSLLYEGKEFSQFLFWKAGQTVSLKQVCMLTAANHGADIHVYNNIVCSTLESRLEVKRKMGSVEIYLTLKRCTKEEWVLEKIERVFLGVWGKLASAYVDKAPHLREVNEKWQNTKSEYIDVLLSEKVNEAITEFVSQKELDTRICPGSTWNSMSPRRWYGVCGHLLLEVHLTSNKVSLYLPGKSLSLFSQEQKDAFEKLVESLEVEKEKQRKEEELEEQRKQESEENKPSNSYWNDTGNPMRDYD